MKKIIKQELNCEECSFIFDDTMFEDVIEILNGMNKTALFHYPDATNLTLSHVYCPVMEHYYIAISGDVLENDTQYKQRLSAEKYNEEKERLEYLRLKEKYGD